MTDELCRDKFIFGLHDKLTDIRTELLKSDKNLDRSVKSLSDIAQVARVLETAASTNTLISKAHQEQVNYADTRNPRGHHKHHVQSCALKIRNAYHMQNWTCKGNPIHAGTVGAINHTHGNSAPRAIKSVPNVVTWIILPQYVWWMEIISHRATP